MPEFEERSPYKVAVQRDFLHMGVAITFGLVYRSGGPVRVLRFNEEGGQIWTEHEPLMLIDNPSIRLDEDFARALYEQLGYYFAGQPDITSSRADYLEERKAHALAVQRHHELAMKTIDAMADMAAMEADLAARS